MLEWMKRRQPARHDKIFDAGPVPADTFRVSGSAPLHKYLNDRFADAVVLTFAEIEDLMGATLPDRARQSAEWWTAPDPTVGGCGLADSWILANRTARPNLQALTVAFDRAS